MTSTATEAAARAALQYVGRAGVAVVSFPDIMLDLETMGTSPDAAIVAIGAVAFDANGGEIGPCFYETIDLASSTALGAVIDAATVKWWLRQSDAARRPISDGGISLVAALEMFRIWVGDVAEPAAVCVWGNGADFDNVILRRAYDREGIPQAWGKYGNRCYRTAKSLRPDIKLQRIGTHHNAADDAESQARHLVAVLQSLGVA